MTLMVILPRSLLAANAVSEPQHVAQLAQGYGEVFVPFPTQTSPTATDLDSLATATQIVETIASPVWVTVPWPTISTTSSTATVAYNLALTRLQTEMQSVYDRFVSLSKPTYLKGFHLEFINASTRFTGTDNSTKQVDRAFVNQLVEKAHLLSRPIAIDGEHPSEFMTAVSMPEPRSISSSQAQAQVASLLGSDTARVDVVILRNPFKTVNMTNGTVPGAVFSSNGRRFGEFHALAKGWTSTYRKFWPYQELPLTRTASDRAGGQYVDSRDAKTIAGLRALFEAAGYTTFGIGPQGYNDPRVLPVASIPSSSSVTANTDGFSTVWSEGGALAVSFILSGTTYTYRFEDDLVLRS